VAMAQSLMEVPCWCHGGAGLLACASSLNLEASESCVLVKKGHVVKLTDDNGKHLGADQGKDEEEGTHTHESIAS
jgi:hypothetical protein